MGRSPRRGKGLALLALAALAAACTPAVSQEAAGAAAGEAPAVDLARGEVVFELCAQCHGSAGEGNVSIGAPAISGLAAWYIETQLRNFRSGARGKHPDDPEGLRMRPMTFVLEAGEGDIRSVAAYVESLPDPSLQPTLAGGDPARGAQLFATCAACHGPDGMGNQALSAPSLRATHDWYQRTQLRKYRAGIRGGSPQDTGGLLMRPMALTLPDEQALLDVVAHISTLGGAPSAQ
jgi:cytochrome c oxidase subunit 2